MRIEKLASCVFKGGQPINLNSLHRSVYLDKKKTLDNKTKEAAGDGGAAAANDKTVAPGKEGKSTKDSRFVSLLQFDKFPLHVWRVMLPT